MTKKFQALIKSGARLHLAATDFPGSVSDTPVICGHSIDASTWETRNVSLVEFVTNPFHCVNCEMMLRSIFWHKHGDTMLLMIDLGEIEL